jgi:hypothetical protein
LPGAAGIPGLTGADAALRAELPLSSPTPSARTWKVYAVAATSPVKVQDRSSTSASAPQALNSSASTVSEFEVTVYRPTGAPLVGSSQVKVRLWSAAYTAVALSGVPGGPAMIASEAGLDTELPVLPAAVVMPLASTLNVYDVPEVSPVKSHDVPEVTRLKQLPVKPAVELGVTRYDAMPAPTVGATHVTVTLFGFPL